MQEEFKILQDIEIKFTRLTKPLMNNLDLPLSGLYNDINNKEYQNFPLKNKFKNFGVSYPDYIGANNIFQLNSSFGKLLEGETIEGLVILTNNSDRDITINNLEIVLNLEEEGKSINNENMKKTIPILFPGPDNSLLLEPKNSYSIKVQDDLNFCGKHTITVNFKSQCPFYNQQYNYFKQKGRTKDLNKYFVINDSNRVELINTHIFWFEVNFPFAIKEEFIVNQIKQEYFIEMNIRNQSKYALTLGNLAIIPKIRKNIKLEPTLDLQQIQNYENDPESGGIPNNSKILSLQPEEEVNLFFKSDSGDIFLNEERFILYIKWLNIFDLSFKTFEYEFKNKLNIFNEYFKFEIIERPLGNIIQKNNFSIVFQFETKQPNKTFSLIISDYNNNDDEKNKLDNIKKDGKKIISNNQEINIKIKQYKIELSKDSPKCKVNIICNSDKLGIVFFPKLYITLFENKNNSEEKIEEYTFKDLLHFNCVQNIQLI